MKIDIVIGLGYGDEGKGNVVNALSTKDTLVVRFNGGQQAGHTVVERDIKHIFASFGSGTLKRARTYISRFCTVDPITLDNERKVLGFKPRLYLDGDAMVTTLYDIQSNKIHEENTQHGTTGMGVGATIRRNDAHYSLRVRDLQYPNILKAKLEGIKNYYIVNNILSYDEVRLISNTDKMFIDIATDIIDKYKVVNGIKDISDVDHIVFEGAQGIMLDMDYGIFPHVTYSNTTSKNAMTLIKELKMPDVKHSMYYITRAYQTRHGSGPMTFEHSRDYINNDNETNRDDGNQGVFRYGKLDIDTLLYAINVDGKFNTSTDRTLVVTCIDQINIPTLAKGYIPCMFTGDKYNFRVEKISEMVQIPNVITSNSPTLVL